MEFSEPFELCRISNKAASQSTLSPYNIIKKHPVGIMKTRNFFPETHKDLVSPTTSPTDFPVPKISKVLNPLTIEKDNSYLSRTSTKRESILLQSLTKDSDVCTTLSQQIIITVFFFHSPAKLKLVLPINVKVSDLLSKALVAYTKSFIASLPYGIEKNGYQVWLATDDSYIPDTDYVLKNDLLVSTLGTKTFCICERSEYVSMNSYKTSASGQMKIKDASIIKFYFEGAWTHVAVNQNLTLMEILPILQKKFHIENLMSQKLYEFRISIEALGEECVVDMSLKVKEINSSTIGLYRKKYVDVPSSAKVDKIQRRLKEF